MSQNSFKRPAPVLRCLLIAAAAIAGTLVLGTALAHAETFRPAIVSPASNSTVSIPFALTLNGTPRSGKPRETSLRIDSRIFRTWRGYPRSITISRSLSAGAHTLKLTTRDARGRTATSRAIRVMVGESGQPTPVPTGTPGGGGGGVGTPDLGANANLNGFLPFPADNAWNTRVDTLPLEPAQTTPFYLYATAALHPDFGGGGEYGIPFNVVDNSTQTFSVPFDVSDESDAGPYPISRSMSVEAGWVANDDGRDHHLIVLNRDTGKLYEIYNVRNPSTGVYSGYSGAIFDTKSNALRPLYWTSSDAAGLPIFPALLKYEEVAAGHVDHALRFTLQHTYNGFVAPARHAAGYSDTQLAPMGMRVRLKASKDISHLGPQAKVIAQAMKTYGMILADNGSNWFFQGTNDPRWDDDDLNTLKTLHGSDFEVVKMGTITRQQ